MTEKTVEIGDDFGSNRVLLRSILSCGAQEEMMRFESRRFAALFLSAAMIGSVGAVVKVAAQDDHERHEQEEHERRVYDADHRDYHNWDKHEDELYRHWLDARHETYVEYEHLNHKMQREYWKWRHENEEHEDHDHH